jgi:hypothetical protein
VEAIGVRYILSAATRELIGRRFGAECAGCVRRFIAGECFFWFVLGAREGYGINIITIGALALNAVAGFLALAAWGQENASAESSSNKIPEVDSLSNSPLFEGGGAQALGNQATRSSSSGNTNAYQYDQAKWQALLEFDPDIARVEATLRPYRKKYVDQFAAGYLILNDKTYISNIIQKVVETARQDAAEAKAAEERWGKRFSDPEFLLKFGRLRNSII